MAPRALHKSRKPSRDGGSSAIWVGPEWVCLGVIVGAQGVRGAVRLKPFTEDFSAIADYGPLTLFSPEYPEGRVFRIELLHNIKAGVAARLEGITDRDQALALKGQKLYVRREALPEPEENDVFYYEDLVGLEARDETDAGFGVVRAVFNFGAGDILEVALDPARNDGETGVRLYPFATEFVPRVDLEAGYVVIDRAAFGERD
ncbi:ribosome maturation factor RimM [Luteithermobacter gelatinilyticus]|uniref:ribosome maturation factor RimM n=1 Tax=Luteithermobacter gelatinilyticus TaxID=2582913 RepID=UPI0011065A3B|nr:ribosome maturation factor RimM [Luteithermobacter gelatinilyticus]|tara:strand:- start:509 stop:1117 length:609 start_codon:yes stop_codon:yes gene_type:complete